MAVLDDLYAQMLGAMPAGDQMLDAPLAGPFGAMPPYSGAPEGFALPLTGAPMAAPAPAESALVDPMMGVTPAFGTTTTAGAQYGYSPQPRPMLPEPIAADAAGLYGPFRAVWEQMQAEPDPLAALMAPAPTRESPFMLSAQPNAAPAMMPPPSPGERALRERGYGRVVDRLNWLRGLRSQQGY